MINSRRLAIALLLALMPVKSGAPGSTLEKHPFKVRTITAGVNLKSTHDLATIEAAMAFLARARKRFEQAGYEVQTVRITTQPLGEYLGARSRDDAIADLTALDRAVKARNVLLNIGPVIVDDVYDSGFPQWAVRLIAATSNIQFSVTVTSPLRGAHSKAAQTAAEAIAAISKAGADGRGNFRFTASANIPPGTPFFPAGYHRGMPAFSIGLETPSLLKSVFESSEDAAGAKAKLKAAMEANLRPIEKLAFGIATREGRRYLGIDLSPAPSRDASIGEAIESLTHKPFGSASTLAACAAITEVLHGLAIKKCGYSGLMLPVLEDPVLAQRAAEGRYGLRELLLYSSVCGTGLDMVPLPGDTPPQELAALIGDVAALSVKWQKPLSARLFLIPGKKAGERIEFHDPFLVDSIVMKLD